MRTDLVVEGTTRVVVPRLDLSAPYPPASASVFYNPHMELSRDINVACMKVLAEKHGAERTLTYLDALAGSGIRGLRIFNEANLSVTLNDSKVEAFRLIKENVETLYPAVKATHLDANVLLSGAKFSVVDIDPFGSPVPFIDAACRSAREMLCVTATDTAPLSGVHFNAGVRRYSAVPANTEYHAETGVRILLGKIAREFVKYDKAITPVLSHATRHYYRTYVLIAKGALEADRCINKLGYIVQCARCGDRYTMQGLVPGVKPSCINCLARSDLAGPLWLGPLHDHPFCTEVRAEIEAGSFGTSKEAARIIKLCAEELDTVSFFDYHKLLKELQRPPMPIEQLIEALHRSGYQASRTHFSGTSIKTDADVLITKDILRELSDEDT
ncbi:MAG: tRNA (guanine(10)-N(2))-dimethyltransferase [Halobacteriota archaeon]